MFHVLELNSINVTCISCVLVNASVTVIPFVVYSITAYVTARISAPSRFIWQWSETSNLVMISLVSCRHTRIGSVTRRRVDSPATPIPNAISSDIIEEGIS